MQNPFKNRYPLSEAEGKESAAGALRYLLYLVLAAVIIITAAHAVMLVLSQIQFETGGGLFYTMLAGIRVAFPIVVEVAAVVAGLGYIHSKWRGGQKGIALTIELIWFLFAAANMITLFAIERGQTLQTWQSVWVQYGLPMSALVAGSLTYMLARQDPDHRRADEEAIGREVIRANEFNAYQEARTSGAMLLIQRRRAFRDVVEKLRTEGYDEDEIALMTEHVPGLIISEPAAPSLPAPRRNLLGRARAAIAGSDTLPEVTPLMAEDDSISNSTHTPTSHDRADNGAPRPVIRGRGEEDTRP